MKRILFAAGLIAALHTPAQATDWWALSRSSALVGVLDSCRTDLSPTEGFDMATRRGFLPHYVDRGDEVDVAFADTNGEPAVFRFFRTREGCLAQAKIEISNAEKYR